MSDEVRFTALGLSGDRCAEQCACPGIAPLEPGVLTVIVYLPVPFDCWIRNAAFRGSSVTDVEQALLYHLSKWIAGRQHTLAPNGRVAEQGYRVADPACIVVKVGQVSQARERICMVGAEQSLRIRADLLR